MFLSCISVWTEDKQTRVVSFTTYSGPGWPWNSAHATTTLCAFVLLYSCVSLKVTGKDEEQTRYDGSMRLLFQLWTQSSLFLHHLLSRCCTNPASLTPTVNLNLIPPFIFFSPPSALKTGSAITRCIGRVYDSRRLTQMVNDNNNLMDGYILLHAWDAANQTAPRSAVLRILQTSCLNYQQRAGDVSARLSVAVPVAPECVRELLSLYHKSVSTLTCALMI